MNGDRHARLSAATPTLTQIPNRPHTHCDTEVPSKRLPAVLFALVVIAILLTMNCRRKKSEGNRTGKKAVPLRRIKIQKVKRKVKDFKIRPGPK